MDFLALSVLILFVLAGGVIAVFADELGRRIGKRRLTLHRKIRPKTSARILAFISGVLIAVVTIVLIGLASSDMRTLMLHGRQAIENQKAEIGKLGSERDKLAGDNLKLATQNDGLSRQLVAIEARLKNEQARVTDADAKLASAQTRLQSVRSMAARLQTQVASTRSQLVDAKSELGKRQAALAKIQKDMAALQGKYDFVYKDYVDLQHQQQKLTMQIGDLEKQVKGLEEDLKTRSSELEQKQDEVRNLEGTRDKLAQQIESQRQDLAQLQQQSSFLTSVAENSFEHTRLRPLIFSVGEELVRVSVPDHTSKSQARERIESALMLAKQAAEGRGAKNANDIDRADLHEYTQNGQKVTVEAQKDSLAIELAGSGEEQVLIVSSRVNAFADEGVLVGLKHQANPVVYRPGQVLAEVRVDGRQDRAKILDSLNGLGVKIRTRALGDKMIPRQSGDTSFGSASSEDILDLYSQIRSSGGSVRVQAVAKRETRAADPLLLSFVVK